MDVFELMTFISFAAGVFSVGFKCGMLYARKNRPGSGKN